MSSTTSWLRAVRLLFLLEGLPGAALFTRMPEVRQTIHVNTGALGLVLIGGSLGALVSLAFSSRLIERWGTRRLIVSGFALASSSGLIAAASLARHLAFGLFVSYILSGFFIAGADVALNLDGTVLEEKLGRSVMPGLHAGYSIGTFAAVGLATLAISRHFSLVAQTVILAVVVGVVPVLLRHRIPNETGRRQTHDESSEADTFRPWHDPTIVMLGLGLLGFSLAEGASNDWLTLAVVQGDHASHAAGGIAYACLTVTMVLTRITGTRLVNRFGRVRVIRTLGVFGGLGIVLIAASHSTLGADLGAALWGLGIALAFPLFLSAAGESSHAARSVPFVATAGYGASLVGPPLLGFLAQGVGLLHMLYLTAALVFVASVLARATAPRS
ncbi:MAG: MFS transporter [Acidimicrobiaceae bacterium]|nr:MFS transporter [Acidimicrobiaceae bacterium]